MESINATPGFLHEVDGSHLFDCVLRLYNTQASSIVLEYPLYIKTNGSESRGQGGSSKQRPDGLETHTREYYTGTRVVKIENAITKEP